ncbi:MAG: flagellar filament capping protein FliD [Sandaracinaceae bacterium]|nr:flagellar filament capping protein FliD [Sandaracinaceae bacterium]
MVSFSGLATGLDTSTIISQLVKAESAPIDRLTAKQTVIDAKSKKLTTLRTKLDDLRNAALALDTRKEALPVAVSSSNTSRVTATVTGGTSPTSFEIEVQSLAKGSRTYSNSFASSGASGLFGTGSLEITTSSGTTSIAVDGSDSLTSVQRKIEALGLPLTTSILNDGAGYRLQIAGTGVGTANAVTVNEVGLTLGLNEPGNVKSVASDARFLLDGIPMTRGSNTVENAFPGVTLELESESPTGEKTTIGVTRDSATLTAAVKKMVDAFNAVNTFVQGESSWTGNQKPLDSLSGDSTLRSVQSRLRNALIAPVSGATGAHTTVASLGISLQRDGSLQLDSAKLAAALASDPEGVATVLGQDGTGAMALLAEQADYFTDSSTGAITSRLTSMKNERRRIDDQITNMQARIDKYQAQLVKQYATLEQTISGLQNQGSALTAALSSLSK